MDKGTEFSIKLCIVFQSKSIKMTDTDTRRDSGSYCAGVDTWNST